MSFASWLRTEKAHAKRVRARHRTFAPRLETLEDRLAPATFTVLNTNDSGLDSLRQAILDANFNAGADLIQFAIPTSDANFVDVDSALPGGDAAADVYVIRPATQLPSLADPSGGTTIDGRSQTVFGGNTNPFGPEVVLDDGIPGIGGVLNGLRLDSDGNQVLGLNFQRFYTGILIANGSDNNTVAGNYIGTDPTGTQARSTFNGMQVGGVNNTIGGTTPGDRNLISGNENVGVYLPAGGGGHQIRGNYIGTNASGSTALGNAYGVAVESSSNTIGGSVPLARNVISGNRAVGVALNANNNEVLGNYIGTDASGTIDVGNQDGVSAYGSNHLVGGTTVGSGNLISGNDGAGVYLPGSGTRVQGNYIGTNAAGTASLGNREGVFASGSGHTVGGTAQGAGNVISGNGGINLHLANCSGVTVQGNFIGTDATGTVALTNVHNVYVQAHDNTIGGTTPAARNVISGGYSGIYFVEGPSFYAPTTGNVVQGNYIGTDVTGTLALRNSFGVGFQTAGNTVGGTAPGASNLISGNSIGIDFQEGASANVAQGNRIGLNAVGTAALGNVYGVRLASYSGAAITDNVIGGAAAGAGNVIAGNSQVGIFIGQAVTGTVVQGNAIGTDSTGTVAWGNGGPGVWITDGASDNIIGGIAAGASNLIAFNTGAGVSVTAAGSVRNTIRGNSLHDNGGLGIDLGAVGVTANDAGDADTGPNQLQNFPLIASSQAGTTTRVTGTLNSQPNTTFILDFYASATADPSGHGEGQRYLGSATVTTDAAGNAAFDVTLAAATANGEIITATATDPSGNTSEFSGQVVAVAPPGSIVTIPDTCEGGTALLITGTAAGDHIVVEPGSDSTLKVTLNGVTSTVPRPSGRIIVLGGAGDDDIQIAGGINNAAWLYGDAGHDRLKGGAGCDVLLGGSGDDLLLGGSGRDLLIGGIGADRLVGNAQDDILIAGCTDHDNNETALCKIMEEWCQADANDQAAFQARVNHLKFGGGLNNGFLLNDTTVHDDGAQDVLTGTSGNDWFLFNYDGGDRATDMSTFEQMFAQDIAFINSCP